MHALCPVDEGGHSYPYFTSFIKLGSHFPWGRAAPRLLSGRTLFSEAPSPEIFDWAELGTRVNDSHHDRELGNP